MVSFGAQVSFAVPHIKIRSLNKTYYSQGQQVESL